MRDIDSIIPGVEEAYNALRSRDGRGLYTSRGSFFNRTIFGRDASMSAKFVADFDHEATVEVIETLVRLQGTQYNAKTQEEPGRIHHEWRDFRLWKGSLFEHIPFWLLHKKWGIRNRELLTYFSLDTTASFIRLVHKYALRIDRSILDRLVENHHGETVTVRQAVELAAKWIIDEIDDDGLVMERRINQWSLPVQTFQDSLYARADGSLAVLNDRIAYIEVQAMAADALYDMSHLFPRHKMAPRWRELGLRVHESMLRQFRQDDGSFVPAVDSKGVIAVQNVSIGWILNTFVWHETPTGERERLLAPIVKLLFSDEFLTPVGLRTREKSNKNPIRGALDYHGSETVWPMFNFMVIEGLRRHRLYRLAEQLENRVINSLNAVGGFPEYHIVLRDGRLILPWERWWHRSINAQMKPEKNIGFSVVPAKVLARRVLNKPAKLEQKPWHIQLEDEILASIELVDRAEPTNALSSVGPYERRHIRRWSAGIRSAHYFWRHRKHTL